MFDSYYTSSGSAHHSHNHTHTHTHKRAPTDESVRLLREMEQTAKDQVIKAVALEGNGFKGVVHFRYNALSATKDFVSIFDLNGHRYTVQSQFNDWDTMEQVVQGVVNDVARQLAIALLNEPFGKALHELTQVRSF